MNRKCLKNEGREAREEGSGFRVQDSEKPSSFILHPSSFRAPSSFRPGFTLVELLVTITIISILAGMSLGAMHYLRNVAAEDKTKATIAKINAIVMRQYESYMTRRIPLGQDKIINLSEGIHPNDAKISQGVAQLKLDVMRDLIRMEMPDRWSDVYNNPIIFHHTRTKTDLTTYDATYSIPESALKKAYYERYSQAKSALVNKGMNITDAGSLLEDNGGPECLYLIVSVGHPEAMEQFNQNEIGDVDKDGCPEFLDGWGKPISFLRWAPGFNQSDMQANINPTWNDATALQQRLEASKNDHDPFDPRKIDMEQPENPADPTSRKVPTGWRLVPLIYSFGPDKAEGLYAGKGGFFDYKGNPYESIETSAGSGVWVGLGTPKDTQEHLDNIHNHRIEQQ